MSAPGSGGVPLSAIMPTMGEAAGNRPTMNLRLSKFNMNMIPDDGVVLFIGRRGTGKSWLIKDLMWYKQKFPIGTVI